MNGQLTVLVEQIDCKIIAIEEYHIVLLQLHAAPRMLEFGDSNPALPTVGFNVAAHQQPPPRKFYM